MGRESGGAPLMMSMRHEKEASSGGHQAAPKKARPARQRQFDQGRRHHRRGGAGSPAKLVPRDGGIGEQAGDALDKVRRRDSRLRACRGGFRMVNYTNVEEDERDVLGVGAEGRALT